MSFFKDFKEDLSQAVNDLLPDEPATLTEETLPEQDLLVIDDPIIEPADLEAMQVEEPVADKEMEELLGNISLDDVQEPAAEVSVDSVTAAKEADNADDFAAAVAALAANVPEQDNVDSMMVDTITESVDSSENRFEAELMAEFGEKSETAAVVETVPEMVTEPAPEVKDESFFNTMTAETVSNTSVEENTMSDMMDNFDNEPATDENGIITEGMVITGDLKSRGSLEVMGVVNGNIEIKGKLDISGTINGNSKAAEIFADSAKITGEVVSLGSVKVGQSSVIVGNIAATSAVIAGAVKGDIDVHGPVILDTSAIVMGDIKSKSVQINNGAVIEGHCSQCYAEVSPTSFFNDLR